MNPNANASFFGHRDHLLDEIGVVFPQLFLREPAAVSQRWLKDLAGPVAFGSLEAKSAGWRPAARRPPLRAPYPIAHVRIGRVVNAGPAKVTQILFVFLDFLISP